MKPIPDWRIVLKKAWSVRLMLLAAVLAGVEAILPLITPHEPSIWWALFTFSIVCGALVARFVAQPEIHKDDQ
jgi:hypothetical protein